MVKDWSKSTISTPAELAKHTTRFIDQFCRQMAFPSAMDIHVDRHPKDHNDRPPHANPVHVAVENQKLTIHLYEKALLGISNLALQGWIDMELARRQLELEPALYRVNFQKTIHPLF